MARMCIPGGANKRRVSREIEHQNQQRSPLTGDSIAARRGGVEDLKGVQLPLVVLPVGALRELQHELRLVVRVGADRVGGLRREEGQLGGDPPRTGRTAEETAQFAQR